MTENENFQLFNPPGSNPNGSTLSKNEIETVRQNPKLTVEAGLGSNYDSGNLTQSRPTIQIFLRRSMTKVRRQNQRAGAVCDGEIGAQFQGGASRVCEAGADENSVTGGIRAPGGGPPCGWDFAVGQYFGVSDVESHLAVSQCDHRYLANHCRRSLTTAVRLQAGAAAQKRFYDPSAAKRPKPMAYDASSAKRRCTGKIPALRWQCGKPPEQRSLTMPMW